MKKTKKIGLDPLEDWLAITLLGNFRKALLPLETRQEIKRSLNKRIRELLQQANQRGPYIDLEAIYPYRKILHVHELPMDKNNKGVIIPVKGGFKIQINHNLNSLDKRITLAHEIGHTFLYDIETEIPNMPYQKFKYKYWVREGYAREIARKILLPEDSITSIVRDKKMLPSIKSLKELTNLYKVSCDTIRLRLVGDLRIWDCIIFSSTVNVDGNITINSRYTSKGSTYKKWSIPKSLSYTSPTYKELYLFLLSLSKKQYRKGKIYLKGKECFIESRLQNYKSKNSISIISY